MDTQGLKNFVLNNALEQRTISGFWNYFYNWQREHIEEFKKEFPNFDRNSVDVFIDSVSLRITNWPEEGYNHVIVAITMHYEGYNAGYYQMVFNLDGTVEDDNLSIG